MTNEARRVFEEFASRYGHFKAYFADGRTEKFYGWRSDVILLTRNFRDVLLVVRLMH